MSEHFELATQLVRQARVAVTLEARRAVFAAAASEFERVLAIDPHHTAARMNLGYCLIELGRYGEAKSEIERVLQESPCDVSALINYAVILQHDQCLQEAEHYLRRAMALDPRQSHVYRDLAYVLEHRRRFRAAADYLERYLDLTPHADDERAIRQRIKLLRQRAGMFELPDRMVTAQGLTTDLRWRGVATLLDGSVMAAFWRLASYWADRADVLASRRGPLFVCWVFLYYLTTVEIWGGSLGKIVVNARVRPAGEAAWYSPLAVRETLKLAPLLLSFLLPFPWSLTLMTLFVLLASASALTHSQGQAWYDQLVHTHVVEGDYRRGRILAAGACLASLLLALVGKLG